MQFWRCCGPPRRVFSVMMGFFFGLLFSLAYFSAALALLWATQARFLCNKCALSGAGILSLFQRRLGAPVGFPAWPSWPSWPSQGLVGFPPTGAFPFLWATQARCPPPLTRLLTSSRLRCNSAPPPRPLAPSPRFCAPPTLPLSKPSNHTQTPYPHSLQISNHLLTIFEPPPLC